MRAAQARGQRERLRMVARRRRADARQRPRLGERPQRVVGAAELERAGALQPLGLEHDAASDLLVERPRAHDRRAVRDARKASGRAAHVGKRDCKRRADPPDGSHCASSDLNARVAAKRREIAAVFRRP